MLKVLDTDGVLTRAIVNFDCLGAFAKETFL